MSSSVIHFPCFIEMEKEPEREREEKSPVFRPLSLSGSYSPHFIESPNNVKIHEIRIIEYHDKVFPSHYYHPTALSSTSYYYYSNYS